MQDAAPKLAANADEHILHNTRRVPRVEALSLARMPALLAAAAALSIRNLERSFTLASHAGAGPRPLHVAPVFGFRYLGGCAPFGWPLLLFTEVTAAFAADFNSLTPSTRNRVRSFTLAIQPGARPCPVHVAPVL